MKRLAKNSLIISGILITVGIIFMGCGYFAGADVGTSYYNGVFHTESDGQKQQKTVSDTDIKDINIEVDSAEIEFARSESDRFEVETHGFNYNNQPGINITGNKLNVTGKSNRSIIAFFPFSDILKWITGESKDTIIVKIPDNSELDKINVEASNGSIDFNSVCTTDILRYKTSNGKIQIDGQICVNESTDIRSSNGKIDCNGIFKKSFVVNTDNGKINVNAEIDADIDCKTDNGRIELELLNPESDYSIESHVSNGGIYINGDKKSGGYYTTNGGKYKLKAATSNGRVSLDFNR